MDRSRSLKRPRDGEPSENSQRQRTEGHASGGFGSGEAGRHHLLFTGTTLPCAQAQEQQKQHESDQRDLLEAHGPQGIAPIQSSKHHFSYAPFQKHPLDNLEQDGQIEQRQDALVQQHEVYDRARLSRQIDAQLGPKDRETIDTYANIILNDDTEIWSNYIDHSDIKHNETQRKEQDTGLSLKEMSPRIKKLIKDSINQIMDNKEVKTLNDIDHQLKNNNLHHAEYATIAIEHLNTGLSYFSGHRRHKNLLTALNRIVNSKN